MNEMVLNKILEDFSNTLNKLSYDHLIIVLNLLAHELTQRRIDELRKK